MNAKQRYANRETAANLKFSLMQWNSRNRKLVKPEPFTMVKPNWSNRYHAMPISEAARYLAKAV